MSTQVGQTISGDQFKKQYPVGAKVSSSQFNSMYSKPNVNQNTQPDILQKVKGIGNFFAPTMTRAITETPGKLQAKAATLPSAKGNLPQAISNAAQQTGTLAGETVGQLGFWGDAAMNVGGGFVAKALGKLGLRGAKTGALLARYPTLSKAGKAIEDKATKAGEIPAGLINKYMRRDQLLKGVTTASSKDRRAFEDKAKEEILGLMPGLKRNVNRIEDLPNTYSKLLEYRKSAGAQGYPGSGNAKTPTNTYYKNLQRAYSDILKEGAGTKDLDKIYSLLSGLNKHKKLLGGAATTAIAYGAMYSLLNKLSNAKSLD